MLFDVAIESRLVKKTAAYIRFRCIKKDVTGFMVPSLFFFFCRSDKISLRKTMTWEKHEVATKLQKRHKAMYKKKGNLKTLGGNCTKPLTNQTKSL